MEASPCWEKVYSLSNQVGVAVGLEDNLVGQEDPGVEKEGARVRSLWDLKAAVAGGREADLSFLRGGQVRNPSQLEVAREHHELEGKENTELYVQPEQWSS